MDNSPTARLRRIADLQGPERTRARDDLIGSLLPSCRAIAASHCRRYGIAPTQHLDDAASIVAEVLVRLVDALLSDPARAASLQSIEAMLALDSRDAVRAHAHRVTAPASGMTQVMRRRAALRALRDRLRLEWGREVTDRELIDIYNARIRETTTDPSAHSALARTSDLRDDLVVYEVLPDDAVDAGSDSPIMPHEAERLLDRLVGTAAERLSPAYGQIARAWLAPVLAGSEPASTAEIAAELYIDQRRVRRCLAKIRALAPAVAATLGIDAR